MIHAGSPFAYEVDFSTGLPTGAVVYSVLGNDGLPLVGYDSVSVTPPMGAVSMMLVVPGALNTVSTPLFETRTVTWTYATSNGIVADRIRYRVERDIVFPVSPDGVRSKLGVEPHEITDSEIDLLKAYSDLSALYEAGALDPYATSGDRNTLMVANAIEAMAGLSLIPTLQLAVARKESSGTNSYERFSGVDWDRLAGSLTSYLTPINDLVAPLVDLTDYSILFFAVSRATDPFTGETAT